MWKKKDAAKTASERTTPSENKFAFISKDTNNKPSFADVHVDFNGKLGKTLYEAFTGCKPNLSNIHVCGSVFYAYAKNAQKLDPRLYL